MKAGFKSIYPWLALSVGAQTALAVAPREHDAKSFRGVAVGIRVIRPPVTEASPLILPILSDTKGRVPQARFKVDAVSGTPRIISGSALTGHKSLAPSRPEDFEAAARAFVAANQALFPVVDGDLILDRAALHVSPEDQFVKLRLQRDGLAIADASIDFRFKFGRLVQVASHAFTEAASDNRPGIEGLDRYARAALIEADVSLTRELYRVVAEDNGYSLVRVSEFAATATNGEEFLVQVESATGQIFELRSRTFNLDGYGAASLHRRWYKDPLGQTPLGFVNLSYNGGAVTTDQEGRFVNAPESAEPRLQGFVGPKVKVVTRSGNQVTQAGEPVRDEWHVVWEKQGSSSVSNDLNVAQAMVFYHTNNIIAHAKEIIPDVAWLNRQLTANANLRQTCNAHWDGRTINFYSGGSGCANTALISDVVFHEWGHGLDDNTGGIEDGAFSEGFGDIVALAETGSNLLGIGFRLDGSPVRDLEPNKIYPRDADTEVHAEGLIIASTFYDLFKSLRDTYGEPAALKHLRRLAMKVILTASRYTDVYEALLPIDDDNGNLDDGTPNYCAINRAFAAHGLARADRACNSALLDHPEIESSTEDGVSNP